ncbi:MAG: hypothetical protein KDI46_06465 [Alphaproteobacteria bacterium]|nr:hypothetical protein [Alphaproteobacteria bacterium]
MSYFYSVGAQSNEMDFFTASERFLFKRLKKGQDAATHEDRRMPMRRVLEGSSEGDGALYDVWPLDDLYYDAPLFYAPVDYEDEEDFRTRALDDRYDILCWIVRSALESPMAARMLEEAKDEGWSVALEDLSGDQGQGPDFHLDVPERLIVLNDSGLMLAALGRSQYFCNSLLISFVRALRDVWQEKRHGGFNALYGPEAVLMLERVRSADMDVMAVLCAWELRSLGHGGIWRHLIGSDMGDLAMRFSTYLERHPADASLHGALEAAFTQWFRSEERMDACDHEILEDMDGLMKACESAEEAFGTERLQSQGIEILSCLPDKTAYLQGRGREILNAPLYSGMNDAVNQAHLMQIMNDLKTVRVQGVAFRSRALADKIFPGGAMMAEED